MHELAAAVIIVVVAVAATDIAAAHIAAAAAEQNCQNNNPPHIVTAAATRIIVTHKNYLQFLFAESPLIPWYSPSMKMCGNFSVISGLSAEKVTLSWNIPNFFIKILDNFGAGGYNIQVFK